jgi:hypothetical protein
LSVFQCFSRRFHHAYFTRTRAICRDIEAGTGYLWHRTLAQRPSGVSTVDAAAGRLGLQVWP